jgi:regulator of sigma E protease
MSIPNAKTYHYQRHEPEKTTLYKLIQGNWLPFGGFVKIFGENPDEENTNGPDRARSFVHKPRYAQALILVAGVVANFLLAGILFSIGFMSGLPATVDESNISKVADPHLVILDVAKDSPAALSHLQAGDTVVSIVSGKDTLIEPTPDTVREFIGSHGFNPLEMNILRHDVPQTLEIIPKEGIVEGKPGIGIQMDLVGILKMSFFKAIGAGFEQMALMTKAITVSLYTLIHDAFLGKADFNSITGPVGIVGVVGDAAKFGFIYLLSFTALISINLGVINLIPFPALDGGRLLFLLIEKIKGSRIKPAVANAFNTIGFALLIILMIAVTYHDIVKLF